MRISLILVRSNTTIGMSIFTASRGNHCSSRTTFSRGEGILELSTVDRADEEMISNDMCLVYAMPRSQTLDEVLADKDLVRSVYDTMKLYTKSSFDMSIAIMNEYGYKLRLASFAAMLRELVNNNEDLRGSTVVADVT